MRYITDADIARGEEAIDHLAGRIYGHAKAHNRQALFYLIGTRDNLGELQRLYQMADSLLDMYAARDRHNQTEKVNDSA